jgi:predicted amidophosphoribosyltransferase
MVAEKKQAKPRVCLRCQKLFPSRGPQNRLCARCLKHIAETNWGG